MDNMTKDQATKIIDDLENGKLVFDPSSALMQSAFIKMNEMVEAVLDEQRNGAFFADGLLDELVDSISESEKERTS